MKEKSLENIKSDYLKLGATWHLRMSGWIELERQIDPYVFVNHRFWFSRVFSVSLLTLIIIFVVGMYKVSEAAVPGQVLYPVKVLSERIVQQVTGNNEIAIDHRASEIIELSKEANVKTDELQKVISDYRQNVEIRKSQIRFSGDGESEFQTKLDTEHKEFENAASNNPKVENDLKEAQDVSDRVRHPDN